MNNFWTRTLTGAVFVTVMMGCIWWSFWSMAGLFLVISVLGLWEFYSLLEENNSSPQKITGIIICVFLSAYFLYLVSDNIFSAMFLSYLFWLFIPVSMMIFFVELFRNKQFPFQNIGYTFLGLLYIQIPFLFLSSLAIKSNVDIKHYQGIFTPYIILGFFFLIWSNDTFAYLVGISIGKHRLFERHSPKKSWEGFIGGIICTQGIAYLLSLYFTELALIHWLVIALIVSVFGTLGDLVESMFKRSLGVKDSGNILPGHGGILDRFDGVLLSSPFVVTYLMLIR
ncbi:MAG: phosphatidate cytidylyltransferase [Bacteroidetes bacterium]|nr:phosphatidate cytidylyltransferase [Bacteroidota bacterium]